MLQFSTPLKATFTAPDGTYCRKVSEWKAQARDNGQRKGRDAAKEHAREFGYAVMVWNNGHAVLYLDNGTDGELVRVKFNG